MWSLWPVPCCQENKCLQPCEFCCHHTCGFLPKGRARQCPLFPARAAEAANRKAFLSLPGLNLSDILSLLCWFCSDKTHQYKDITSHCHFRPMASLQWPSPQRQYRGWDNKRICQKFNFQAARPGKSLKYLNLFRTPILENPQWHN